MADEISPHDERDRPGGQYQSHRFAAQLRDRQIFRQRGRTKRGASTNALQRYEKAAVVSKTTLSLLNIGQGFIISLGFDRRS